MTDTKTILVVDDDSMIRSGLQTMLQHNGYRTLEAEDGVEAKDLIEEHHPDLVILDMMMPRWGGFAVLEHFQHNPAAPPFMMLSGQDGEKHKAYAKQIGVVDYIHKPYSMERLLQKIELFFQTRVEKPIPAEANGDLPSLRVTCPACGARIKAPGQMAGQTRPCPRCSYALIVRELPLDEGPRMVTDS